MEKKVDPVRVMPDAVWEQVLQRLDPDTLSATRAVSRGWSERAVKSAVKREDIAVHASINQVQAMHGPAILFVLRFWYLAIFRTTHLFDYVRAFHEVARARVLASLRIWAVVLIVAVPFVVKTSSSGSWLGTAVQTAEVAVLILPGFVKLPPRVSSLLLGLITLVLIHLDGGQVSTPLPLVTLLVVGVIVWSLFSQRLPGAIDAGDHVAARLPLFFVPMSLPLRSLRFVGWIVASAATPLWLYALTVAAAAVLGFRGRKWLFPLPQLVQYVLVALCASLLSQMLVWQFDGLALVKSALLIAPLLLILNRFPVPWFDRSLLMHAKAFRMLAIATVIGYAAAFIWTRVLIN